MTDTRQYVQARKTTLSGSGVTSTATTVILSALVTPQGANITTANFGTLGYGVYEPGTVREENFSFTIVTQNADGTATLTVVTRGLNFVAGYAETSGLKQAHAGGTDVIISNSAPFYDNFVNKGNDETITGTHTFTTSAFPKMSDSTTSPTASEELATKGYVDTAGLGTINANKLVLSATAGETVAKGEVVYFDTTDKEWKLADASSGSTADNVMLGIAQGAGTNGAAITGGVLLEGRDTNQAGLTVGKVFLSDTGGDFSASAGTQEVELGQAISATAVDFKPRYGSVPTGDEKDAMVGSSGTPSTSNTFITEADVSDAAASGLIVRATGTALPALDGSNLTGIDFPTTSITAGETINGATLPVAVFQNTSDNEFYACDANDNTKYRFVGFAVSDGTDASSMTIRTNGVVAGFTGLAEGEPYFVQDDKTISTTAGTQVIFVGKAISTTQILIEKKELFQMGQMTGVNTQAAGTTDETITLGFRPTKFELDFFVQGHNSNGGTNQYFGASGTAYCQGAAMVYYRLFNGGTGVTAAADMVGDQGLYDLAPGSVIMQQVTASSIIVGTSSGSDEDISMTMSINAISSTGFTVRFVTVTGGGNNSSNARAVVSYRAWGE